MERARKRAGDEEKEKRCGIEKWGFKVWISPFFSFFSFFFLFFFFIFLGGLFGEGERGLILQCTRGIEERGRKREVFFFSRARGGGRREGEFGREGKSFGGGGGKNSHRGREGGGGVGLKSRPPG